MVIQIVSPSFNNDENIPAINRYPCGRTIGYMNVDGDSVASIKSKLAKSVVEVYYLDKPKFVAKSISIGFNKENKQAFLKVS